MDYKKEYKEALERAKAGKPMDEVFPDLKESEDERIRKNCIHFLELQKTHHADTSEIDDCIAYLERQKEHQNNSDALNESSWTGIISSSDKDSNLDELAQEYIDGVKQYNPTPTWDLMQTAVCYGYHLGANHQVPDDEHLLSAIQVQFASHAKVENGKRYAKLTWDEFKKIAFELCSRDKQKEQKLAEWSEEDLQHKSWILECLADGERKIPEYAEDFRAAYKWLKSLRPQPHWKPSEEQVESLKDCVNRAREI